MTEFFITGLNHRSAPVRIRERFALVDAAQRESLRAELASCVDELVLLATCNRTEMIYVSEPTNHSDLLERFGRVGEFQEHDLSKYMYTYRGEQALSHLCRVASGIDSLVVGETQILGQVKDAFNAAFQSSCAGGQIHQLYQRMLHATKAVRNETALGCGLVSVSSVAVELAHNIFERLAEKEVLLLGAGEMGELAARSFFDLGVRKLSIINRSQESGQQLADRFGVDCHPLDALGDLVTRSDILLCSTSSPQPVVSDAIIRQAMRSRRHQALLVLDIAVPRDVDANVEQIENVYLYNIDDLQRIVDDNMRAREGEIDKAEQIIADKIAEFYGANNHALGPVILSLQERVGAIKEAELERLFRKNAEWSDSEREQIQRSMDLVTNKILHDPIISLRRELERGGTGSRILHVFKDFFNLS